MIMTVWEVLFILTRGGSEYRTVATHYAADATDAIAMAENATKTDCAYSWEQCRVVAVLPASVSAEWDRATRNKVWEAAQ